MDSLLHLLERHPLSYSLLSLALLGLAAFMANWLTKRILLRGLRRLLHSLQLFGNPNPPQLRVINRLANSVPALVLAVGINAVPQLPEQVVEGIKNLAGAAIVFSLALALSAVLDVVSELHESRQQNRQRPIKGYVQLLKIALFALATILAIATLIDRSPLILLSGLGAMAAVLMLIFQDTLLSLVASVQLNSNDMIRLGDWIEMPQQNANGTVVDIALHTVMVRNFDNSTTSIPTKKLISDSFKNWRSMPETGGRRLVRALLIDQQSIHFLSPDEQQHLAQFELLHDYLDDKRSELESWNSRNEHRMLAINQRRLTNIGSLRVYIDRYLRQHSGVHQGMNILVYQKPPTADGLPVELYCFSANTDWAFYENLQSDIFDHLLAILPEFGLRVFQHPSGHDLHALPGTSRPHA